MLIGPSVAAYAGGLAAENALTGAGRVYDLSALPHVIFTDPQVASVGLTEATARAQGKRVKTAVLHLKDMPRALAARDTRGLIKLVAEEGTGKLLGAHVLADQAGEVIQAATLAVRFGLRVQDLVETFHPYLTMVEGLLPTCCGGTHLFVSPPPSPRSVGRDWSGQLFKTKLLDCTSRSHSRLSCVVEGCPPEAESSKP